MPALDAFSLDGRTALVTGQVLPVDGGTVI